MVVLLLFVVLSEVVVVIVRGGWWCVCTPVMVMFLEEVVAFRAKMRSGIFFDNFVFWWSGDGVFLPAGSAIAFDRDFWHFWQRSHFYSSFISVIVIVVIVIVVCCRRLLPVVIQGCCSVGVVIGSQDGCVVYFGAPGLVIFQWRRSCLGRVAHSARQAPVYL